MGKRRNGRGPAQPDLLPKFLDLRTDLAHLNAVGAFMGIDQDSSLLPDLVQQPGSAIKPDLCLDSAGAQAGVTRAFAVDHSVRDRALKRPPRPVLALTGSSNYPLQVANSDHSPVHIREACRW